MLLNPTALKQHFGAFKFYGALIVIILVTAYLGYRFGNEMHDLQANEISRLEHSLENLRHENDTLVRKFNVQGVELEVQRLAAQRSQSIIQQGIEREASLREELAFYQKVMAPELKEQGFAIEGFNVEALKSDRFYRFDLVLMQQSRLKNVIKGNLDVTVSGSLDGSPKTYDLISLMPDRDKPLTFSFKYFQVLEGQFAIPEGFVPEKISVHAQVFQFKKKRGELTRSFDWITTNALAAE